MKKYYDPEYDRIVDESVPKKQYEWFAAQRWFHKTYEEFLKDNFLNENLSKITGPTARPAVNAAVDGHKPVKCRVTENKQ